jgi:amidase
MSSRDHATADVSAIEWTRRLRSGEISARELLALHRATIATRNDELNAVVTFSTERADAQALAADEAFARGELLGLLHGLPVAHKDLVPMAGVRTTFGSPLFADFVPDEDDELIARQVRAGAVSIGKTNTPEFGAGSHTFNRVFGPTRNPHDPVLTCGGSSGGAAVALATGMVALADGSDLGGSLRNPAAFCGVVGLRPSPGRVPSWPDRDPWGTMAVVGPMARSVADVAFFLAALAGVDARLPLSLADDPAVFAAPIGPVPRGLRVAWSPRLGDLPVEPEVLALLERSLARFATIGAEVEAADPPLGPWADEVFETLRAIAMEAAYGPLVDRHPDDVKETIRWNVEQGRRLTGPQVGRALLERGAVHQRMVAFWDRYDALVLPVTQVMPFPIETEYPTEIEGRAMGSYLEWMRVCSRITVTGSPAISVPAGICAAGLPVGLQIVTPNRTERFLLELAHAFEQSDPAV